MAEAGCEVTGYWWAKWTGDCVADGWVVVRPVCGSVCMLEAVDWFSGFVDWMVVKVVARDR